MFGPLEHFSITDTPSVRWLHVGREHAPTTGTPHLQLAVMFDTTMSLSRVKSTLGTPGAHFEIMMGTPLQCKQYNSKEDESPMEHGTMPEQGRTRLILNLFPYQSLTFYREPPESYTPFEVINDNGQWVIVL